MRRFLAFAVLLGIASSVLAGNLAPLSLKEVSLMLRSGYTSDAVEHELAACLFMGACDPNGEKSLPRGGASPALIRELKWGALAVPATDLAAVQAELAAKAQRKAAQLEEAQKFN